MKLFLSTKPEENHAFQSTGQYRNKSLQLPKMSKAISDKNSLVIAMRAFNKLPNDLKILTYKKSTIKYKLKQKLFR